MVRRRTRQRTERERKRRDRERRTRGLTRGKIEPENDEWWEEDEDKEDGKSFFPRTRGKEIN